MRLLRELPASFKEGIERFFLTPLSQIKMCFLQPDRFKQEYEIPRGLNERWFHRLKRRFINILCMLPAIYISATIITVSLYILFFLFSLLRVILGDGEISIVEWCTTLVWLEGQLLLPVLLLSIIGGTFLGERRGITMGLAWGWIILFHPLFLPNEALFTFAIIGAFLFGTVFYSADLIGDMVGSILWAGGVIILWLLQCGLGWRVWNIFLLFSCLKMLALLVVVSLVLFRSIPDALMDKERFKTRLAPSLGEVKSGALLVWISLWTPTTLSISFYYILYLIRIHQPFAIGDYLYERLYAPYTTPGSLLYSGIYLLIFMCAYILGIMRILTYPLATLSMIRTYRKARRHPTRSFIYLQKSCLYSDECVFLPLPFLEKTLNIGLQQADQSNALNDIQQFIRNEKPQQMKYIQSVLQDLSLKHLEHVENWKAIADVYKDLIPIFPRKQGRTSERSQRIERVLVHPEENVIDFTFALPFIPFFDVSRELASYREDFLPDRFYVEAFPSFIEQLQKVHMQKGLKSPMLDKRLQAAAHLWIRYLQNEYTRRKAVFEANEHIKNPYLPDAARISDLRRNPEITIRSNRTFVGREDVLKHLLEPFSTSHTTALFSLTGASGMGKTSLLNKLSYALPGPVITVIYDFQKWHRPATIVMFLTSLAQEIVLKLNSKGISVEALDRLGLQRSLRERAHEQAVYPLFEVWLQHISSVLTTNDFFLFLAFDELIILREAVADHTLDLDLLLHWFHRCLTLFPRIGIIFCDKSPIAEMGPSWLKYFSKIDTLPLGFLHLDDIRSLAAKAHVPGTLQAVIPEEIAEEIFRYTGGHPFLAQTVCYEIVNLVNRDNRETAHFIDLQTALQRTLYRKQTFFATLWEDSTTVERDCLFMIHEAGTIHDALLASKLQRDVPASRHVLQKLLHRNLVLYEQGEYRLAIPLFMLWLEQYALEKTDSEREI